MLVPLIIAVFGLLIWRYLKRNRHLERCGDSLPGPRAWPLLGNSLRTPENVKDTINFWGRLIDEFGDVCRLWINGELQIILNDPKDIEAVLRNPKEIAKSTEYKFLREWLGTGLVASPAAIWTPRRKALTPSFHFKILEQFVDVINLKTSELVGNLQTKLSSEKIDLFGEVKDTFAKIVCETSMGIETDAMGSFFEDYFEAIKQLTELITYRKTKFYFRNDLIWRLTGGRSKEIELSKRVSRLIEQIIQKKESRGPNEESTENADESLGLRKKTAFLEMLLNMKKEGNPAITSNQDVIDEANTFFFGGHDTTSTATSYAIEMLAHHPSIQENLYDELKTVLPDPKAISTGDIQNSPLLDRFCKETLRLYPSVPTMSRQLINDLQLPSGYLLPKGSTIVISIFHLHRHPDYFTNPAVFNPDNFLPENACGRHPFAYIPFSAGPRNCIAQRFATIAFKMAVAKFVCNFKVSLPEGSQLPLNLYENVVLATSDKRDFILSRR